MKKISLIMALLMLILAGCGGQKNVKIEDYIWTLETVQNSDGEIIGYGENSKNKNDSSNILSLTCMVLKGELVITDKTNSKLYYGKYNIKEENKKSIIYDVEIESTKGHAVTSYTKIDGEESIPTLIVSTQDYTLTFFHE